MTSDRLIRVAQAADPLDARLLLGVLESYGIRASIQGEALWAARGELPFTPESAPSVWVTDQADARRARQILAEHAARPNPAHCPKCGCDLRTASEARCPECGAPFRRVGRWTCPHCRECIGTQFTHCWNCGAQRGDIAETLEPIPHDSERTAASPPCARCDGTGRIERPLLPIGLVAVGAFLGFAAIRNLIPLDLPAALHDGSLFGRGLFALAAILCFYFARRVRFAACACKAQQDDDADP